jgi:hypothetical protein
MIKLASTLLTLTLLGCANHPYDPRLEGVWTSNKELTLNNLGETSLTEKQLTFLKENLGDIQFTFKNHKTAINFTSDPIEKLEFKKYKTVSINTNSVTIIPPGGTEKTLTFDGNCFYIDTDWSYREYFCK